MVQKKCTKAIMIINTGAMNWETMATYTEKIIFKFEDRKPVMTI